jgi:2-polyprenyl-3-methyl-5-hydroxy-6-metoxy-1,4-benzoquinol methylase
MLNVVCPVCSKIKNYPIHQLEKAQNGCLLRCQICDLIFFAPQPTSEQLQEFYGSAEYRQSYTNSPMGDFNFSQNRYSELQTLLIKYAKKSNQVFQNQPPKQWLDVGCGTGGLLQIAALNDWVVTGTEMTVTAAQEANSKLGSRVWVGDISTLEMPENTYDLITSYHVIEHLLEPVQMLRRLYTLSKSGGIVFIETPNIGSLGARIRGSKWSQIKPPEHIAYFQPASLKYALRQAGFKKFVVFTSTPQIIESAEKWPSIIKSLALSLYGISPLLGLGAALQAIAFKD